MGQFQNNSSYPFEGILKILKKMVFSNFLKNQAVHPHVVHALPHWAFSSIIVRTRGSSFLLLRKSTWTMHFLKIYDELISKLPKFLILDHIFLCLQPFEIYFIKRTKMACIRYFNCFYEVNFKWLEAKEKIDQN